MKPRLLVAICFWVIAVAWTAVMAAFLGFVILKNREIQGYMIRNEAVSNFNKDKALRSWCADHGGVYVPVRDKTQPNPYLLNIEDRDIKTPSGKLLTLMNPAYMLRQVEEVHGSLYGVHGHLTSLKFSRPETAPDQWERSALQAFERGVKEVSEVSKGRDGTSYFRYMAPLKVEEPCLKCHGKQGYKVGDIRGGISLSVPMAPFDAHRRRQTITFTIAFCGLWLLGACGCFWANRTITRLMRQQERAEAELKTARDELGQLVEQRTADLNHEIEKRKQKEIQINAALQEKGILLREVHHRVKNNMQVIISLLRLQAGKINDKQLTHIFKDAENRVRSMALIHEQLYETKDFAKINFRDYLGLITNHLFRDYGVSTNKVALKIEVGQVFLGVDSAIPCGLIVNELISNALKYAFPGDRKGEIRVTLRPINEAEVELAVSDDGIGIPEEVDVGKIESFGLELVHILAQDQLDGTLELVRGGGTSFRIRFRN